MQLRQLEEGARSARRCSRIASALSHPRARRDPARARDAEFQELKRASSGSSSCVAWSPDGCASALELHQHLSAAAVLRRFRAGTRRPSSSSSPEQCAGDRAGHRRQRFDIGIVSLPVRRARTRRSRAFFDDELVAIAPPLPRGAPAHDRRRGARARDPHPLEPGQLRRLIDGVVPPRGRRAGAPDGARQHGGDQEAGRAGLGLSVTSWFSVKAEAPVVCRGDSPAASARRRSRVVRRRDKPATPALDAFLGGPKQLAARSHSDRRDPGDGAPPSHRACRRYARAERPRHAALERHARPDGAANDSRVACRHTRRTGSLLAP